jgi:hypothetical protein
MVAEPAVEGLAGGGEDLERRAEIIGPEAGDVSVILILGWPESAGPTLGVWLPGNGSPRRTQPPPADSCWTGWRATQTSMNY